MALFIITTANGDEHQIECSLQHAMATLHEYGHAATLKMIHPGTSGHGEPGQDF